MSAPVGMLVGMGAAELHHVFFVLGKQGIVTDGTADKVLREARPSQPVQAGLVCKAAYPQAGLRAVTHFAQALAKVGLLAVPQSIVTSEA